MTSRHERAALAAMAEPKARRRRTSRDDEFYMQAMFFNHVLDDARLSLLPIYAIPNFSGHYGSPLQRVVAGQKAKRAGRRKGVPDVNVDVARAGAHGLRIEFKVDNNKPKPEQDDWHAAMREQGYLVVVCTSADAALSLLYDYLANGTKAVYVDRVCEVERAVRAARRRHKHALGAQNA